MISASELSPIDSDSLSSIDGQIASSVRASLQELQLRNSSRDSSTLLQSLECVHENLQLCEFTSESIETNEILCTSVYALWLNVILAQLEIATFDLLEAIQHIPDAILYWKFLQRNKLRAKLEQMPTEWLISRWILLHLYKEIESCVQVASNCQFGKAKSADRDDGCEFGTGPKLLFSRH